MATPIDEIGFDQLSPTLKTLAKAGGTTNHTDWMRGGKDEANARMMLAFINEKMATEAAQKRAAEEAGRIVIMDSGYNGGPAEMQRCRGPYRTYPVGWTPRSAVKRGGDSRSALPGCGL